MRIALSEDAPLPHHLRSAILLYSGRQQGGLETTLAVEHQVISKKSSVSLGAGRFVTASMADALMQSLGRTPLQYVPPHVIALSRDALAWYEPAAPRRMLFAAQHDVAVNAFDNVVVPQPPLVFIARRRDLLVFALMTDARPTLETPLAAAPYWNVFESNAVCLGSMVHPETRNSEDTDAWRDAFFGSNFTHLSSGKRWAHPGTYAELLAEAAAAGHFNPAWLRPAGVTLREAICSN